MLLLLLLVCVVLLSLFLWMIHLGSLTTWLTNFFFLFPTSSSYCLCAAGDHLEEVAEMIVTKFGVSGDAVFLDLDGEFVSYA